MKSPRPTRWFSLQAASLFSILGFFGAILVADASSGGPNSDNLYYADVVRAATKYDEVIVWEGLPRDFEPSSHSEKLGVDFFRIGDQVFYTQPLTFKDEEKTAVSDAILKHIENFKLWSGVKLCGGFHADFALEWRYKGATLAQALLCFSCHEARFVVGDRVELVDQSDEGFKNFRALLLPHRRPQTPGQPQPGKTEVPKPPTEKMVIPKVVVPLLPLPSVQNPK